MTTLPHLVVGLDDSASSHHGLDWTCRQQLSAIAVAGLLSASLLVAPSAPVQAAPDTLVTQTVTAPAPPVAQGDSGQLVAWWQARLNEWLQLSGSATRPLDIDGVFGAVTEAATLEFQNAIGAANAGAPVEADGIVDPVDRVALEETIEELRTSPGAPSVARGDTGQLVGWWQARLNQWLQLSESTTRPLDADGVFGPATDAATLEFQNAVDAANAGAPVEADSIVDPVDRVALEETIEELRTSPGAPAIALGDRGQLAAWWQDELNQWLQLTDSLTGTIAVDGWFGPQSEAATIGFQTSVDGLATDGVVDPEDRVALSNAIDTLIGVAPNPEPSLPHGEDVSGIASARAVAATPQGVFIDDGSNTWVTKVLDDTSQGFALLVDDLVVYQASTDVDRFMPTGDIFVTDGSSITPFTDAFVLGDRELVLHDVGHVDGKTVMLVSSITRAGPTDSDHRLLLIDTSTFDVADLGSFGGFEASVREARFGDDAIAVLQSVNTANSLSIIEFDGTSRHEGIELPSDRNLSLLDFDFAVWVVEPAFVGDDFQPELRTMQFDLTTADRRDVVLPIDEEGIDIETGFCARADFLDGRIVCDRSRGAPLSIDVDIDGSTTEPISGLVDGKVMFRASQ